MDEYFKSKIVAAYNLLPEGCRKPRATDADLAIFDSEFGKIPNDYRWFLSACGGSTVGSEWVDSIVDLPGTHRTFLAECALEDGWSLRDFFIIGWDGSGNPFGIDSSSGKIVVEDHNFGGVHELSETFSDFLERGLVSILP